MKKLVLVIVCVLILTLFIAFNYLLWERESMQNISASKSASIDALGDKIKSLNDTVKQKNNRITKLDDEVNTLKDKNRQLSDEKEQADGLLSRKLDVIAKMKKDMDVEPLKDLVRKWVDSINKGDYESAYYQIKSISGPGESVQSMEDFTALYKDVVRSFRIKSCKLMPDIPKNTANDEFVLEVSIDAGMVGDAWSDMYKEGANTVYFHIGFDDITDEWTISDISKAP